MRNKHLKRFFLLNRILECLCYAARGVCFAINVSISTHGVNGKNKRRTLQKGRKDRNREKIQKVQIQKIQKLI